MRKLNHVVLVSLTAIFCLMFTAVGFAQTTVSTASVDFYNAVVNTVSPAKVVSVTNTGASSISISNLTVTAGTPYAISSSSTCSSTLAAGASCNIKLTLSATTLGPQPAGTLTITTTAPNSPQMVSLAANVVEPTALSVTSVAFGNVPVNTTSAVKTVTLYNYQLTPITISPLSVAAPYAISGGTCGSLLGASSSCTIQITLTPTVAGAVASNSLTVLTNAANSPLTLPLSGAGVNPTGVSPTSINFGGVVVGQASPIRIVTLTNYQATSVSISSLAVGSGTPYSISSSSTCLNPTLAAGASCTVGLTLNPVATGAQPAGALTITTNASNSPLTVTLSGTGVVPVRVSPAGLSFGNQVVGTTSAPLAITLTNSQPSNLSITEALFGGPFVLDTSAVTTCPISGGTVNGTLPSMTSCVIGVDFKPTALGATSSGQFTLIDSATNSPQTMPLSGVGIAAVAAMPSSINFGYIAVNTTSAAKTIVVTNNQAVNLDFSSISAVTPYAVVAGSTTCVVGTPVIPGGSCVINVTYSPTTLGLAAASALTIVDDASTSPQLVTLLGGGSAPVTLSPAGLNFGQVVLNIASVKSLTLTNSQSVPLVISSITGYPAGYSLSNSGTTCQFAPNSIPAGGSCVIQLSLTATVAGPQTGVISINDNAPTSPQIFGVNANAVAPLTASPATLSFTGQSVATTSAPQTITLTNQESTPLAITAATLIGANSSDFAISSTTCPFSPGTIAPGGQCTVSVTFTPSGAGTRSATLNINDPTPIPLTGIGNAPVTVLPGLLSFTAPVGTTSTYQTVTIKNAGTSSVQFNVLQLSGPFVQTSTSCGTLPFTLAGGASCAVTLSFNPLVGGVGDGQLQVYDTAVTSPQVINLTANGTLPLTISPTWLGFSGQLVGSFSTAKTVVLTNHENKSETFSLTPAGDFQASSNCPMGVINANSNCNISVVFNPSATGTRNGSVTVTDSAAGGSPLVLSTTGSGTATNPAAAIAVISPGAGGAGTTVNVVITGNGWTNFNTLSSIQVLDQDSQANPADIVATIPNPALTTPNTIHAQFVITGGSGVVYGARYVKIKTPLSGGGTEYASLNSAFTITDPSNAHIITTVTPANVIQGQTQNVDLTATGTHFVQGVTYANFGDGVTVNTLAIDPGGLIAHANITVSNTTPVGNRTITLVTGGEFATSSPTAFYIGPNSATFTALTLYSTATSSCTATPVVEPQGWSGAVCLTATGTHFLQNATGVAFTGGILTGNVQVTSPLTAIAQIAIQAGATIGLQNATVSTGGEIASLTGALTVTGATPYLVSVTPNAAQQGTSPTVVINANSYMNFVSGQVSATFDGNITSPAVNVVTPTQVSIPISISNNANVGSITANLIVGPAGSTTLYPFTFTVTPSNAAITSVTPSCVPQGGQLTLNVGAINTNWVQGTTTANFYPVPVPAPSFDEVTINSPTSASLAVAVPTNTPPGPYGFYVSTGGQVVSASINVCAATPTLTMSPANGLLPSGSAVNSFTVNFTGQFTHFANGATNPVVSGEGVTLTGFNVTGTTSATATINIVGVTNGTQTATGPRKVTFTTNGEIVSTYFNVTQTPVGIINISPYQAPQNTTTTVEITGLNTHFNTNTTQVLFGPQITVNNASLNVLDATHLTVSVTTNYVDGVLLPTPYGWQNVYVNSATGTGYTTAAGVPTTTNGAGSGAVISITASNGNLTSCTATTPGSGYIVGDYVYPTQSGATGSACLVTAVSGSGVATLTSSTEQVMGGFLVDSPALPSIVSVVPNNAPQGGTLTGVVITGNLTHWDNTTEAILGAGVTVSNLNVTSPTTATADLSVSPTAPVGGNSVIMITGAIGQQQIVSGSGFSVTPNAATISIVSPVGCNANAITIADLCGVNNGSGTPYVVTQLQTATLNVVGVGTHWLQGETVFSFGTGVVTDALVVTDSTHAQVQITVLSTSPVGYASLTTTTDGEVVTLQQAIDIEEGFPALLATTPNAGEQANTFDMQVLGRFTNWGPTTVAQFNKDITVNSINVIDNDNMILNVTVSPWAYVDYGTPCGHYLTITTGTVQEIGDQPPSGVPAYYFCVQQGGEEITNVTPLLTPQGSTLPITITGQSTNFVQGVTQVSFNDSGFAVGQITVNSPTSLTVPVAVSTSASSGFKNVTVTTYGQVASQLYGFTVTPSVATLNEAIPNQAEQGAPIITSPTCSTLPTCTIRLIGQYSHFSSLSTATFGAGITVDGITLISPTEVDAQINIDPISYTGGRLVTVTTPGVSCAYQPPIGANVTGVSYPGCTPGVMTGTGSEIVSNNVFTIIQGPAIISQVSPNTGNEGQEVVFNITGEATHWSQSFTRFYIAGGGSDLTVNSVTINSATSATVDLTISPTANPGPRSIYMVTDGETLTDSGAFVVTGGVPVITYISPNNGLKGTTGLGVDIYGLYTQWTQATTTINFGPGVTVASYQVDNNTHIEAVLNIDPAAQQGYRTVTAATTGISGAPNGGIQVLTSNFLVTVPAPPPTPYIWYESPSSGLPGQTFTITFYGAYTQWDPNPTLGTQLTGFDNTDPSTGITINSFQVTGPTTALANITIGPNATAFTSDLTLTTNTTIPQEVDHAQFNVVIAQPRLSVVDPGSAMQGTQNLTVNIIGSYTSFDSTTTFDFGPGVTVNGSPTIIGPTIASQSISVAQLATLGGRSVVATTADVIGLGHTVGGGYLSVTPSLAQIAAVTPNTAAQGATVVVDVTGLNTHWDGSTNFQFGSGIVVVSHVPNTPTDATLKLYIPPYTSEGPTWASATTLGEVANLNNAFVVQAGTPYLLSSGPGSEPQQGAAVFTILSQATQWLTNPPVVSYGDGVVLTNVNVTSNTSLTVDGYIQPTTATGWRNLTVSSSTQTLGLNYALYIAPGPAVINNVVANSAGQGATLNVTINGINTHWQQGVSVLNFPNVVINGNYTVVTPTQITANITVNDSAPAGEESVTVTTLGEVATGVNVFDVIQTQPELLGVVAATGASAGLHSAVQGWTGTVNLTGAYTHFTNSSVVSFGSGITVNTVSASSSTSLQVNISISPTIPLGWHTVSVTSLGGSEVVSVTNAFQVTVGPAAIVEALNPYNAPQSWTGNVIVVGSQTHWVQNVTTANFGPYININTVTIADAQHATVNITVQPNAPLTFYDVSLTTVGEVATGLGAFTVTSGAPSLIAINPPFGHLGDGDAPYFVEITGRYTHFVQGTSVVNFGAGIVVNSIVVNSATDIQANITINPSGTTGSRTITVTTGTEVASMTGGFTILPGVPALTTATPSSGQAGQTVTVTVNGQFTNFQQGFTSVSIGGLPAPTITTVNSLTQVQATFNIPSNASVGTSDITVTTNGTPLTLSGGFTVTPGTPVVTGISPNIGNPGQTALTINLTGQYTTWTAASTVTIGTVADGITVVGAAGPGQPGPVTFNSAHSVSVTVNIASGAPVGPADVTIATGGSSQIVAGGFTVQAAVIPPPSILSISPGMNAGGIPINSNFYVVFSQPMNLATFTNSNMSLRLTSNQNQGWITIPIGISGDATGRILTITPSSPLAVNSQYYLYLSSGIKDSTAAGNSINNYGQYFNTVYTASTVSPTVVAFNPPALSTEGTNVPVELEFSVPMNQGTDTGMTVTGPGGAVAGSFLWNSNPFGSYPAGWGPGTVLYFTPTAPLAVSTTYTVAWGAPLADTEGNAVTPGSFTFTTSSGADTTTNSPSSDIANGQTNVGTNVAPKMFYAKPINPININTGTVALYNSDSGKYINGTVTVSPDGMSATFTPSVPLLPNTYYRFWQGGGYFDADGYTPTNTGAYLNGWNTYFTTGSGTDLTAPNVASVSPANSATAVPLNAQVIVSFNSPISPEAMNNIITVTPSGGSPISGTTQLASDLVTLFFEPSSVLAPGTNYTISVSGYQDVVGNVGAPFSSTFTTATSIAPINVSTGFNASGQLITTNDTADANWVVYTTGITSTPSEATFGSPALGAAQPLLTVGPGNADWWGNWPTNGPSSDWVTINPNSSTGNTYGLYYTTFNISGSVPANLCLVGQMGIDDNGLLAINGTAIMGNLSLYGNNGYYGGYQSLYPLNIPISSNLVTGTNVLALGWGSTDNSLEAFRLQATIQTCGVSELPGTSVNNSHAGLVVTSATPSYSAGGVATNSTIQLVFNNPLDPATVNSTTLPVMVGWNSNAEIAGAYTFSTTNVPNDTVTFTPDTPFPVNTQIWVGACNGPYDLAGDNAAYNGCYTQITYFNTATTVATGQPANTAFQVMAFTPAAGATNVGLRAPVTATFNRSLNFGSINNNDYALFNGDGQTPWCDGGSYSHSQDGTSISFNCGVMPSSATLTAVLGSGLSDWNGDSLTPYTSQFSTTYYDYNTHGSLNTQRPGNGASGVNANLPIVLYFNYPINPSNPNADIEVAQNNVAVPGTAQILDGGFTLEFTPSVPWTPGALIQWWTTGNMTDTWYNATFNGYSGYFYVAGDTSTMTPSVQVASPAAYTYSVPLNSIFDLQFNTPLNSTTVNSTNVYIFDNSNGNIHIPVTITQPQPNEILMVPTSVLPANHYLYVYIGSGLQSTTSVPASSTQWYDYTGTTSDSTLPVVTSAVPFNGATGIGVNEQPGVIFNKAIDTASLNSSTFQVTNGGTPLAGSYWFSTNDTRVEFIPNAPLPANTNLVMTLNGVTDQVGNPVTFSSSFTTGTTPDVTAPSVINTSITSSGSVPTNASITIQFSTSMDATTFSTGNNGDIYIYDAQFGGRVPATLSWNSPQTVAYLTPTSPLSAGRTYYFYVNSGTDLAGNQVTGIEITFYATFASASTPPTVINFNPISGATGVGTNAILEAQFSSAIDPNFLSGVTLAGGGPVTISTSLSAGNTILQLVPSMPLAANTNYTITIAGVKDPAGNTVPTVTNSFTTGPSYDLNAAAAVNIDPSNYATVGTNVTPKIVFNKPLNPIYANNSYFQLVLNDTGQWIPLNVMMSADGKTVTLTPQEALLPNTEYRYYAGSGLQDENGNSVNGGWWYFYTSTGAATSPLTVTSISPANGSTGIPLNAQVIVMLSAPMDPTSVTQNSIQLLNGATPVAGTVNWINAQELTFAPTSALAASTAYTVNVAGFKDANGNAVVPFTSSFTTGTLSGTGGLSFTGSNIGWGATVTNPTQAIVMTFSQPLDPATVNSNTLQVMDTWNSNRGLPGTYTVGTGANANQVTFTPANPYPSGAQIYVGECGGPTDILGEVFQNGGCYGSALVMFYAPTYTAGTVGDPTSLSVVSVSPANHATNVGRDQSVSVTFSNPIYNGSAGSYNTQLFAGQDLQTNGNVTWSADGRTMTFNVGALYNGAAYTIVIPAGGLYDEWGNSLTLPFTSTFTTAVDPATGSGSVLSTNPGNTSGVPTNNLLTLFMNRQVNASTVSNSSIAVTVNGQVYPGTVAVTGGGYEIQYTPNTPFPYSAAVQWWFSGNVQDVYGDLFNGNSGYFYIVGASPDPSSASPTVIATSPHCCGSTGVPTNANVDIEFSQPIDSTTLNTSDVWINSGPATPYTVGLAPGTNNVVRVTPSTPWNANTWYGFCTNASIKGTNGVAATYTCWAVYFTAGTTTDTTPGTVKIGPPNGVSNVGTNAYIRLQFSKPVDITTINTTNVAITTGGNPIPGSFSYSYSGNDVIGVNFSPVNPLPSSSPISVSVSGVLDYGGNTFTTATSNFNTAATPDYTSPAVTLDFGSTTYGIATNASFTCHYQEAMDPSSVNSGNTFIYSTVANGNNWGTDPWTYTWSTDLTSVTMTPVNPLFANSEYYYACYGAIDLTGNSQSNAASWFYTGSGPSSQGPQLLYANPPNGMTNVPVNSNNGPWYGSSLGLLFNEPVANDSLGNITLTPQGGSPIPIGTYPEYGNTIVWVQLPWSLLPNTQYTFNVSGVTDVSGNAASGSTTSTFTTGSGFDYSQPSVVSASPANGVTTSGVPTSVSLTMSEALNPVLITSSQFWLRTHNTQTTIPTTITISSSATPSVGTTITLTPVTPLAESTIYDIMYWPNNWWPTDIAGNNLSNYGVESTFTTGATGAVNGACGSANGGTFSVPPPTANLCSAGSVTGLTNAAGALSWSCNSQDGGTNASCSAAVTPAQACYPQNPGLVSWWKGDDDATDLMGHNNGTLENGAGFALGAVNDAFSFNGNNQYVLIGEPVPADLQIQNNITLSAWIYPTAYPTSNGTPSGSATWGMIMGSDYNYNGASVFLNGTQNALTNVPIGSIEFALGDGSAWHLALTTTQVPLNQWTLVTAAATANNPMQVYFNGVAQPTVNDGTSLWTGTVAYSNSEWFAIGQDSATNYPFNGLIDEVQVYNTALSTAQVQGLYNVAGAGVCSVGTASTVGLSSSNASVPVGTSVTITASITPSGSTGTVTFTDNTTGSPLGTETVSGGLAAITTSALVAGTHNITASYSGDSVTASSNSTPFYQSMTEGGLQCAYKPTSIIDWYPAESNANDTVGGVTGTAQGTIGYATGEVGQAFNFTALGDVSTSLASSLNTAPGTQFTVSFWMYWNGTDNQVVIGFPNYDLAFDAGGFGFNTNSGDIWGISESGLANKWVQVTAVFNNGNVKSNQLYINGVQQSVSQQRGSSPSSIQVQTPAYIGGQGSSYPSWYFNGLIDEVQFFNGALTPAQVQGIYNAGSAGVCP
ncbi:MAG: Ig-like domain-containing protein [Terracidiphilus sp.]